MLACILANTRSDISFKYTKNKEIKANTKDIFSCLCGSTAPKEFAKTKKDGAKLIYQCVWCKLWSHKDCLSYNGPEAEFICSECCSKIEPIKSGCTLIITPPALSNQWLDEIKKHVLKKDFKCVIYEGTKSGFIHPRNLSELDVCITTYKVLANELGHVFSDGTNQRALRQPKRYMQVHSPLVYVDWWRICLDEAQMVHSTNSKCAEMANRLSAVNRWCITGTPIGRSLADLHGLFSFIRENPYCEKIWFKQVLFDPYKNGDKQILVKEVSKVLWRTSKKHVQDQINIPKQSEKLYWLNFSPFETHLYERVLSAFRINRDRLLSTSSAASASIDSPTKQIFEQYATNKKAQKLKIDELDPKVISRLLSPLTDLRITCNHPQLILKKSSFMSQTDASKEKMLSMEKSLELLIKKTKQDCESHLRSFVLNSNAIAGLEILNKNYSAALAAYQLILDTEKSVAKNELRLDLLQKVHACFNYIECIKLKYQDKIASEKAAIVEKLSAELDKCESLYLGGIKEKKKKLEAKVSALMSQTKGYIDDNRELVKEAVDNVLAKIARDGNTNKLWVKLEEFSTRSVLFHELETKLAPLKINKRLIKTVEGVNEVLIDDLNKIVNHRVSIGEEMKSFFAHNAKITHDKVVRVAECHLRESGDSSRRDKCSLCSIDSVLKLYGNFLFNNNLQVLSDETVNGDESGGDDENDADNMGKELRRRKKIQVDCMTRSDFEKIIRIVCSFANKDPSLHKQAEMLKKFIEKFEGLKDEFKQLREYWGSVSDQVNAMDELELVKKRMSIASQEEFERFFIFFFTR